MDVSACYECLYLCGMFCLPAVRSVLEGRRGGGGGGGGPVVLCPLSTRSVPLVYNLGDGGGGGHCSICLGKEKV
jgi:hypothetical protein